MAACISLPTKWISRHGRHGLDERWSNAWPLLRSFLNDHPPGSILRLSIALLLVAGGCGKRGNHAAIRGQVALDGEPLVQGSILFVPIEGTNGVPTGTDIKAGRYVLTDSNGPPVGWNRVEISAVRPSGKMAPDPLGPPGRQREMYFSAVASRFNTESTLKVEVKPGDNTANFDVSAE